ncbi:MAG: ATP synthase F1 subunit epsilon [Planctomycetes bacterium]|nr:ATP synthase F1 subunit epsilon [Planctomycetota bacterium]
MAGFNLRVVSPEKILLEAEVTAVQFPGEDGFFGVLPKHAAMVSLTDSGPMKVRLSDGTEKQLLIHDGFAEMRGDALTVLTRSAEEPSAVDLERAQQSAARAKERIQNEAASSDLVRAQASLRRALIREKYGRSS